MHLLVPQEFGTKCRTKKDALYHLKVEQNRYLPDDPYINVYWIKDIIAGKKKVRMKPKI